VQTQRGGIRGRGPNQRLYLEQIRVNDLTFGIGPAGTGKTYLAVASAVEALHSGSVRRIVLRSARRAGPRRRSSVGASRRCSTACDPSAAQSRTEVQV